MIVSLWFVFFGFVMGMGLERVDGVPSQFRAGFTCVNGDTYTVQNLFCALTLKVMHDICDSEAFRAEH